MRTVFLTTDSVTVQELNSAVMAEVFSWWRVITIAGRGLRVARTGRGG